MTLEVQVSLLVTDIKEESKKEILLFTMSIKMAFQKLLFVAQTTK
ncbi:hypothetical protein SEEK9263_04760 [Salmonella enterica subsp. enterica serovar Kentucky str. ATCC 9263]|nr:hypothetical protein SEEK9263_04760 [Salmonella enterica subsp. enterica serovar Kentucky str. ATCC 9263]